jgi:hypothetical protein
MTPEELTEKSVVGKPPQDENVSGVFPPVVERVAVNGVPKVAVSPDGVVIESAAATVTVMELEGTALVVTPLLVLVTVTK